MKNYKISIIIPIFNVEKYLENCLKGVINQTLDDVEIICVNDGSTDNSMEILKKYSEYIKIVDQENKGPGPAKKAGIDNSSGDYILVVDADDFIANNACEVLYNHAIRNDSDIVFYNFCHYFEDENKYVSVDNNMIPTIFEDGTDFDNKTFNYRNIKPFVLNRHFATWAKFFKASFIKKYDDLYFPEHDMNDDVPLHVQLILRAKKISWCSDKLYFYRRTNSQSLGNFATKKEKAFQLFKMFKETEKILVDENKMEEFYLEFIEYKLKFLDIRLNLVSENIRESFFIESKNEIDSWKLSSETINQIPAFYKTIYLRYIESNTPFEYNTLKNSNKTKKRDLKKDKKINKKHKNKIHSLKNIFIEKIKKGKEKIKKKL